MIALSDTIRPRARSAKAEAFWKAPRGNEDVPHLERIRDTKYSPVFVMGLHRSGTTWLCEAGPRPPSTLSPA